jgi:Kinase non-catalytic C-lobe domain
MCLKKTFICAFQLAFHLGLTIFRALEFGFQEEEERRLGADLERLIDLMTAEPGEYLSQI